MYGIYKIYNYDSLIYIGKTTDFHRRLKNHLSQQPWNKEITHIEIAECKTKIDMDLCEKYYINKLNPKYNRAIVYNEIPTFAVEELEFKRFELEEFLNINKDNNSKLNNINRSYERRKQEISDLLKISTEIKVNEKVNFMKSDNNLYHFTNPLKTDISFLNIRGDLEFFKYILNGIRNNNCKIREDKYIFVFEDREDIFRNSNLYSLGFEIDNYSISEKRISKGYTGINFISGITFNPKTKNVEVHIHRYVFEEYFYKYFK